MKSNGHAMSKRCTTLLLQKLGVLVVCMIGVTKLMTLA